MVAVALGLATVAATTTVVPVAAKATLVVVVAVPALGLEAAKAAFVPIPATHVRARLPEILVVAGTVGPGPVVLPCPVATTVAPIPGLGLGGVTGHAVAKRLVAPGRAAATTRLVKAPVREVTASVMGTATEAATLASRAVDVDRLVTSLLPATKVAVGPDVVLPDMEAPVLDAPRPTRLAAPATARPALVLVDLADTTPVLAGAETGVVETSVRPMARDDTVVPVASARGVVPAGLLVVVVASGLALAALVGAGQASSTPLTTTGATFGRPAVTTETEATETGVTAASTFVHATYFADFSTVFLD